MEDWRAGSHDSIEWDGIEWSMGNIWLETLEHGKGDYRRGGLGDGECGPLVELYMGTLGCYMIERKGVVAGMP